MKNPIKVLNNLLILGVSIISICVGMLVGVMLHSCSPKQVTRVITHGGIEIKCDCLCVKDSTKLQ